MKFNFIKKYQKFFKGIFIFICFLVIASNIFASSFIKIEVDKELVSSKRDIERPSPSVYIKKKTKTERLKISIWNNSSKRLNDIDVKWLIYKQDIKTGVISIIETGTKRITLENMGEKIILTSAFSYISEKLRTIGRYRYKGYKYYGYAVFVYHNDKLLEEFYSSSRVKREKEDNRCPPL